ncbi:MAG: DNA polymerase III subunit delta [Deltaproteobacteria bacterium]|nr:DNA polymerase III subunit delta [Deltaproteobacteria bacterium]
MSPDELRREVAAGKLRPAYLLAGAEPLLRDEALASIRGAALDGTADDFNFDRLSGESTSPGRLREAVQALPIMASHRLVVLNEPQNARGAAAKKELGEGVAAAVRELVGQEQTVLVVCAAKADKRSAWVKAFKQPAALVECEAPGKPAGVVAFVRKEAADQEVELGPGVAEMLAERVGSQLLLLRQEIAKVALLAGSGARVTRDHVEMSTGQIAEQPVWDLTDAIGDGHSADAVTLLGRILGAGAPAPVVLGALASHFRRLARVSRGGSVRGAPWMIRKLEKQARRYGVSRLLSCLKEIHQADAALKGAGSLDPGMALERLVMRLAS